MTHSRWPLAGVVVAGVCGAVNSYAEPVPERSALALYADTDDDDGDGVPDRDETPPDGARDVEWLTAPRSGMEVRKVSGESARLLVRGQSFIGREPPGHRVTGRLGIQGIQAGTTTIELRDRVLVVVVCDVTPLDVNGRAVSPATSDRKSVV